MTRPIGERHRLELPMIDRPPRRIIPTECLGCGKSDAACDALYGTASESCCHICKHDDPDLGQAEREAEARYREMAGMDLPLEERRKIARRNAHRTPLSERPTN